MWHSSLRNVVERIFGVVKKRFPVLVKMNSFEFPFQCTLVNCAVMLHNFLHLNQKYEDIFYIIDDNRVDDADEGAEEAEALPQGNARALIEWRDGIARQLWQSYVNYNANNL
jgi:hypothetical protein